MNIITSGYPYIDIDAYAGIVAYAELLNLLGRPAKAVSTAPFNESITSTVRKWGAKIETLYTPSKNDRYFMIDLCNPKFFEKFVNLNRVSEVIDHHPAPEILKYWQARVGDGAHIEFLGSVCTIIYERWQVAGRLNEMSTLCARLLVTAIIENTLNFGAVVSGERDVAAYKALREKANMPSDWAARYFGEMQAEITKDIAGALVNDTKIMPFQTISQPVTVGQLVVWDAREVAQQQQKVIANTLGVNGKQWFLNLVSVSEKRSYFICRDAATHAWLSQLLSLNFNGPLATADRLWLRKEIIKQDLTNKKIAV